MFVSIFGSLYFHGFGIAMSFSPRRFMMNPLVLSAILLADLGGPLVKRGERIAAQELDSEIYFARFPSRGTE